MIELENNSKPREVVAYIGRCIDLYPDELTTDEVASYIVGLGRYDWSQELSRRYGSYCELMDIASDMEWQEQPGDWAKLLKLYEHFINEVRT